MKQLLQQTLDTLVGARVSVSNELGTYIDHPANRKIIDEIQEQLAKVDASIAELQAALGAQANTEHLTWHDATTSRPDADTTVLCWSTGDQEFFCGYFDDSLPGWIGCESGGSVLCVTHWAEPQGPATC